MVKGFFPVDFFLRIPKHFGGHASGLLCPFGSGGADEVYSYPSIFQGGSYLGRISQSSFGQWALKIS
jgi:hypothetical protein